jgi:hypothetical protein
MRLTAFTDDVLGVLTLNPTTSPPEAADDEDMPVEAAAFDLLLFVEKALKGPLRGPTTLEYVLNTLIDSLFNAPFPPLIFLLD